jgi:hypothetical protein
MYRGCRTRRADHHDRGSQGRQLFFAVFPKRAQLYNSSFVCGTRSVLEADIIPKRGNDIKVYKNIKKLFDS